MMAKLVISGSPISVPSITGGDILPPSLRYSSVGPLKPEYLGRKNDGTEIGANFLSPYPLSLRSYDQWEYTELRDPGGYRKGKGIWG